MLLNPGAKFDLAVRLRSEGAPIGELYSFISGLYFRGKLAYVEAFAAAPAGSPAALVITTSRGMVPIDLRVTMDEFVELSHVPIDESHEAYRVPLVRDARALARTIGPECCVVLLGSIATAKYVAPLLEIFGDRLVFPGEFVGRGDMSRGGLMLRCARAGTELEYVPVAGATLHGPRPPKLPKLPRGGMAG
jgi:hypothetical protein